MKGLLLTKRDKMFSNNHYLVAVLVKGDMLHSLGKGVRTHRQF